MKVLSRILTICLCSAPLFCAFADGPVATTAGSNLTAFNPSTNYNNQWNSLSSGRTDTSASGNAKADFGNCDKLISRCAQPKCGNGGCTDQSVAEGIVNGCVLSNPTCKKYGDDLIKSLAAQLVASSNTKLKAQEMQIAQMQSAQSQAQMEDMRSQMQEMQQTIQRQNEQTSATVQNALAAQQAQHEKEMAEMKAAAVESAKKQESGLTAYEEQAIANGASSDLMDRRRIAGEIITKIEDTELSMSALENSMSEAFKYAKCDDRGNNCSAPKRIKKFRSHVTKFSEPYDNIVEKIYEALDDARMTGINVNDIIMMLDNSCQSWAQYLCQPGSIQYLALEDNDKGQPYSCPAVYYDSSAEEGDRYKPGEQQNGTTSVANQRGAVLARDFAKCLNKNGEGNVNSCIQKSCRPCEKIKVLTSQDQVFTGWVETDFEDYDDAQKVVACSDAAVTNNNMFRRHAKGRNGAGLVDPDALISLLSMTDSGRLTGQTEAEKKKSLNDYCYPTIEHKPSNVLQDRPKVIRWLKNASISKSIPGCNDVKGEKNESEEFAEDCICRIGYNEGTQDKRIKNEDGGCAHGANPLYALCDTHVYNAGEITNDIDESDRADMDEIIRLKTTIICQQLYKQYEYLKATLRRLQVMLEKAVYTSNLEVAGAKSESGSSGDSSSSSGNGKKDKTLILADAENCSKYSDFDQFKSCVNNNVNVIIEALEGNDKSKACRQLLSDLNAVISKINISGINVGTGSQQNTGVSVGLWGVQQNRNISFTNCANYMSDNKAKTTCDSNNKKAENIRACAYEMSGALSTAQSMIQSNSNTMRAY